MAATGSLRLGVHTFLPYPQEACRDIEHHLHALRAAFPSFDAANLSPFVHNDGREDILVNAAGALPDGPEVFIWLVEAYPYAAPLVFLTLAGPPGSRPAYVDSSGLVTAAPYLRHWRWPESDLVGLVQSLSVLVESHPHPPPTITPRGATSEAIESITDAACQDLGRLEAGTARMASVASALRQQSQDLRRRLRAVEEERDALEEKLQMATVDAEVLDRWLATSHADDDADEPEELYSVVGDAGARQGIESEADELASEDVLDALDAALRAERVSLWQYLKAVKDVARAQFLRWPVPAGMLARPGAGEHL